MKDFAQAYGVEKSAVSENFIEASRERLKELLERPLGELRLCAVLIDGTPRKDHSRTGVRQSTAGVSAAKEYFSGRAWLREWLPPDVHQHVGAGQDEPIPPNAVEPGDGRPVAAEQHYAF